MKRLDEREAYEVMRAAGLYPCEPYPGVDKPWKVWCDRCERNSTPRLQNVKIGGGCRHCNQRGLPHAEDRVVAEMRAANLEPLEPYRLMDAPWRCRCLICNREVYPRLQSIRAGGGCRYCRGGGIDPLAPADVYLIHHPELRAHKVGIKASTSRRLTTFARSGWQVHNVLPVENGRRAWKIEQATLSGFRERALCPYLTPTELPDGWTETIDAEAIRLPDLWERIVANAP